MLLCVMQEKGASFSHRAFLSSCSLEMNALPSVPDCALPVSCALSGPRSKCVPIRNRTHPLDFLHTPFLFFHSFSMVVVHDM